MTSLIIENKMYNVALPHHVFIETFDRQVANRKNYVHFKNLPKSDKGLFFTMALIWFHQWTPSDKEYIHFNLHNCHYKILNKQAIVLKFFHRLKRLKSSQFKNTSFAKFVGKN